MNKKYDYLFLFILLIFHLINNLIWLKKDSSIPDVDQSVHLSYSIIAYNLITHPSKDAILNITKISSYYPPFFHISTTPFYFFFGTSVDSACLVNILFLFILIISTYEIARIIYNRKVALLSSFLISFYPIIFQISRKYFIDLALASIVSLGLYLLIKTEKFEKRNYSIIFGFIFGLGMLTKWTYAFFLIVPLAGAIDLCIKKRKNFFNFLFFITISILTALFWYLPNIFKILKNLSSGNILGILTGDPAPTTLKFYFYYLKCLYEHQIYHLFILFIIGILIFLFKKKSANEKILFSHILGSYLILTFVLNKDPRFSLPLLCSVSIISSFWIFLILNKKFVNLLIFIILAFSFFQFFNYSYKVCPPSKENLKLKEISKFLVLKIGRKYEKIGFYSNHEKFNHYVFKYYCLKEFLENFKFFPIEIEVLYENQYKTPKNYKTLVYVLKEKDEIFLENYKIIKKWKLKDNSIVIIYEIKRLNFSYF
jgi:4-amino-4-deoxy-L-arabinose transferase-like glycosyltransferase